jgi:organic radical activating enzyme
MTQRRLELEIHLSHACNLTCDSCSHFSNYHFSGVLSLETAESWYRPWASRLRPGMFSLLGGEPTINPRLCDHILLARRYWPISRIRVVTNGLLLHKHPTLPEILKRAGNSLLQISKHYDSQEFENLFAKTVELANSWKTKYGIPITIKDSVSKWTQRYRDEGGELRPFADGDPRKSWEVCRCRNCKQLFEAKLWKCPILAYLPMLHKKRGLSSDWDPYLGYQALQPDCTQGELETFLAMEDEPYCSMCPAHERQIRKGDPLHRH